MDKQIVLPRVRDLWLLFFVAALGIYFLEHAAFIGSLGVPSPFSNIIDTSISLVARVVVWTWIWGMVVDILSGEDTVARYHHVQANIMRGWWIALLALAFPRCVHFFLFIVNGREVLTFPIINAMLGATVAFWAADRFLRIKHGLILVTTQRGLFFPPSLFVTGLVLTIVLGVLGIAGQGYAVGSVIRRGIEVVSLGFNLSAFAVFVRAFLQGHPQIARQFDSDTTLVLVNLPSGGIVMEVFSSLLIRVYPPFFAVLRALTPPEYRVIEYNRVLWRERFFRGNALVAISCYTSNCADAYRIAREFRRRGSRVVMGGPHVSFFPMEALEYCDSVVVGPAEGVWDEVVRDYEGGSLKRIYQGGCSASATARVHKFLMEGPVEIAADCLQSDRGCKFDCYFCANSSSSGVVPPRKPLEDFVALVSRVSRHRKVVFFLDNNIYADPAYAKELFRALKPLKMFWAANTSIDMAHDDEAVKLLKDSGCVGLLVGYEIDEGSEEKKAGGKLALAKDYVGLTRKLQRAGIHVKAHFMFGFPMDDWRSLLRSWWFCMRLLPSLTVMSFLTPIPGARFFGEAVREGRIIDLNWRKYDLFHQVWRHPRLGCPWLLRQAFSGIMLVFLFTASSLGRLFVLVLVLLELIYFVVN